MDWLIHRPTVDWERIVSVSDIHVPFEDKVLLETFIRFLKWYKPHTLFLNGDIMDCLAISRFLKDPKRELEFQDEVDQTIAVLERIRAAVGSKCVIYFIPGNHEDRIERYLYGSAKELAAMRCLKLGALLELSRLNIILAPPSGVRLRPDLHVYHGTIVRKSTGASARGELERWGIDGISGHTHRLGSFRVRTADGIREWTEQGCLCQMNPDYMTLTPDWCPGFVVVEAGKDNEARSTEVVPAVAGRFMFRGKIWS